MYRLTTRTRAGTVTAVAALVAIVAGLALPAVAPRGVIQNLFFILTMLTLAQIWNLLAGYGGLVSVGQQAFVGIGAYAMFAGVIRFGWNPLLAIPLGGIAALLLAIPTAFFAFRLQGAYFAIGTWVMAEVTRLLIAQWKALGGGTGISLPREATSNILGVNAIRALFAVREAAARDILAYWLALALVVAATGGVYWLLRSRLGLALAAVRDNIDAAQSVGVDAVRLKWAVFLIAAAALLVLIGGIGTIEGPILGVLVFVALRSSLADYGSWYMMTLGLIAIAVMLFAPKGLWGLISARTDLHLFPVRRRLVGPKIEGLE